MKCRTNCGACCIIPSISASIPGMPDGKPAGVPCIHLDEHMCCRIFNDPRRPETCANFKPEALFCGNSREDAITILQSLES